MNRAFAVSCFRLHQFVNDDLFYFRFILDRNSFAPLKIIWHAFIL